MAPASRATCTAPTGPPCGSAPARSRTGFSIEFDKVYKLYDLKVWNSNQLIESFIGFGAKKVTIEYSADGTTWTALDNVPEFARATGMPGYAANTTVNLGGVMAKFVKLTINSTWGGVAPSTGLSEVRFSYVPVQARAPQPATAATGVAVDASLNWRPGREAGSHQVFFGTDPNAVASGTAAAKTVTDHGFAPGSLNFGTTYYWKVDEVNTVTYPGDVWSFTTQEYAAVDDFESYNDDDKRIYDAWIDGYTDGNSGSIVGYMARPRLPSRRSSTAASSPCRSSTTTSRRRTTRRPRGPSTRPRTGRPMAPTPCRCTSRAGPWALWTTATTPSPSAPAAPTSGATPISSALPTSSSAATARSRPKVDSIGNTNVWAKGGVP